MLEIFDYELLRIIWWILLGVLLIGFAIMDGFDLGVGILLPFIAKNDSEKRIVINSVGPVWDGNQVWFILLYSSLLIVDLYLMIKYIKIGPDKLLKNH